MDKEIVNYEGESGGVGVMAEEHGGGKFGVAVLGEEGDKAELDKSSDWGRPGTVFRTSQKRKETKF